MDRDEFLKLIAKWVVALNVDSAYLIQEIYGTVNIDIDIKVSAPDGDNVFKKYSEAGSNMRDVLNIE